MNNVAFIVKIFETVQHKLGDRFQNTEGDGVALKTALQHPQWLAIDVENHANVAPSLAGDAE